MKRFAPLAFVLLAACSDEPPMSVSEYLAAPEARADKLAECRNDPGGKALDRNCINAGEAAQRAMFRGNNIPKIR